MEKYSCIIIEDNTSNVEFLKIFLKKYCPKINIVGEALNVKDVITIIPRLKPDIIFSEVMLDNESGFDLFEYFKNLFGEVIIITKYKEFALKAIKHGALDYILKPIDKSELISAINNAIEKINAKKRIKYLENQLQSLKKHSKFLAIPSLTKIEFIKVDSILFCEADGRYTIFHFLDGNVMMASKNIGEYEKQLKPNRFFRIHNRYMVNLEFVKNIDKSAGNYCELMNGLRLPIAKRRQESLCKYLMLK